jgi:hypothetical protein
VCREIGDKVSDNQAHRILVNLEGTDVTPSQLRQYLEKDPIDNLKEIILIDRSGNIKNFFPFLSAIGMSGFTYNLEIATPYTPAEICGILRDNLPFVTGEADYDSRFPRTLFTTNEALQIDVASRKSPELAEETFGFRPTVIISFEQAKYTEPDPPDEGHVNMIRAVDWIVNHLECDLVFLVNRALPAILRRDGHIWLDRKDYFWMPQTSCS